MQNDCSDKFVKAVKSHGVWCNWKGTKRTAIHASKINQSSSLQNIHSSTQKHSQKSIQVAEAMDDFGQSSFSLQGRGSLAA